MCSHVDIFVARGGWLRIGHMNSLIRNNGDGTFTDITHKIGMTSRGASHTMDFADINRDGLLDIFFSNEDLVCELWMNKGNDVFEPVASILVEDCGLLKGMVFTDYNDDMVQYLFPALHANIYIIYFPDSFSGLIYSSPAMEPETNSCAMMESSLTPSLVNGLSLM